VEKQARILGQDTLILGSLEEAESFYLDCGFRPHLFIQISELDYLARLEALNPGYEVAWKAELEGSSRLMLYTPQIDKVLQGQYDRAFPNCHTQTVFIKNL
jgi:hypothetical protein